jgi:ribosome-binding factor A
MAHGARPERLGDLIRAEMAALLAREVKDRGIGFVTLTEVRVTADLQLARVYYTTWGDAAARQATARALDRAAPFLRRQMGRRLRLKRIPRLEFVYDESIEGQDRIERLIRQIHEEAEAHAAAADEGRKPTSHDDVDDDAPERSHP